MDKTGITIREVLDIPILQNARVLAGGSGLNRVVQFIDIMEVPDLNGWVKEGVLMLTTAYAIRHNPSELAGLIQIMDQGGAAALAIKPARFLKGIPQSALEASDETGLPLIEVPSEIPYTDITRPIMERVLDRQAALLRRSEEVYRTLTQMVLQNSGIQAVTDSVAGLIQAPVAVIDNEGRIIVSSPAGLEWVEDAAYQQWTINVDRRNVAKLIAAKPELDEMERVGIEQARLVLALELMRGKIVADTELRLRGNFIDELLTPPVPPRHEVEQRGRKLGMNVEHLWEVAVVEGGWAQNEEVLSARLEQEARTRRVVPHVEFRSNRAVMFLPSARERREGGGHDRTPSWAETLEAWAADKSLGISGTRAGLGGRKPLWEIYDSYNEARKALRVSRKIEQERFVVRYEEVEIFDLLGEAMELPAFASLFERKLGKLRQYDEEHNSDLMRTFLYYLESRGSLIDTANRLYIHRNSVKYRLERIRDITGYELNDSREQLVSHLCLIYYYMRVKPADK